MMIDKMSTTRKIRKSQARDDQTGSALVVVMIVLLVAALTIPPLLNLSFAGTKSADTKERRLLELYAADSGLNAAMHLIKASAFEEQEQHITSGLEALTFDDGLSYQIPTGKINECDVDVRAGKTWLPQDLNSPAYINQGAYIATPSLANNTDISDQVVIVSQRTDHYKTLCSDDFESGSSTGGNGTWSGGWVLTQQVANSGDCRILKRPEAAWDGAYHLELTTAGGSAMRVANITGYSNPYLKMQVRADDFITGDEVECKVSPDGSNWIIAQTWVYGNDTKNGRYSTVNIPLSGLYDWSLTDKLYLKFETKFSGREVAWDNFETFTPHNAVWSWATLTCSRYNPVWNGGAGWMGNWVHSRDQWRNLFCVPGDWWYATSQLIPGGRRDGRNVPGGINNQLCLDRNNLWNNEYPYAYRKVNCAGLTHPRLEFWARPANFDNNQELFMDGGLDVAYAKIGNTTIRAWNYGDNSNDFQYYECDLEKYTAVNSTLQVRFDAYMAYNFWILLPEGNNDLFYVDSVRVVDSRYFYVDDVVIADETRDAFQVEIAYTTTAAGPVFMDRLGIWLPPGTSYDRVVGSNEIWKGNNTTPDPDNVTSYKGGTALEWYLNSPDCVNLAGGGGSLPYVKDITLRIKGELHGIYTWLRAWPTAACNSYKKFTWDKSCDVFKVVSAATHPLAHHVTKVETYVVQGQLNRNWYQSFGDYAVTGNSLLVDANSDVFNVRETSIDGLDPSQSWNDITEIPANAEVKAAWLYWSAWKRYYSGFRDADTGEAGCEYDDIVEFMHNKRFYKEVLNTEKASMIIRPGSDYSVAIPGPRFEWPWLNKHYPMVDDVVQDGLSSQVWVASTNVAWTNDLYGFTIAAQNWPVGDPPIASVKICAVLATTGAPVAAGAQPLFGPGSWTTLNGGAGAWRNVGVDYDTDNPYIWDITGWLPAWTWDAIKNCHFGISLRGNGASGVACSQVYLEVEYLLDGGSRDINHMQTDWKTVDPDLYNCVPPANVYLSPMHYTENFGQVADNSTVQVAHPPILDLPAAEKVTVAPRRICNRRIGYVGMDNGNDTLAIGNKTAIQPAESVYFKGSRKYHDVALGWLGGNSTDVFVLDGVWLVQPQPAVVRIDGSELGSGNYTWLNYGSETESASIRVYNPKVVGGDVTIDYVAYYEDTLPDDLYDLTDNRTKILADDDLGGNITMSYSIEASSDVLAPNVDYIVNRNNGSIIIVKDCLIGNLTVEYWTNDALLGPGNYTIDYNTGDVDLLDPLYSEILPLKDQYQVKIDYTGKCWEKVTHEAWGKYGEELAPLYKTTNTLFASSGHAYLCFADVTSLIKGEGCGNGPYDVRGVAATLGGQGIWDWFWPMWAYSSWSLVVVYDSPGETAHQLYIWDPLHNSEVPLVTQIYRTQDYILDDFKPPEVVVDGQRKAEVDGRITYCIGEGDEDQTGDVVKFKGGAETTFFIVTDPTDTSGDKTNMLNSKWLAPGNITKKNMDIDTFNIKTHIKVSDTDSLVKISNFWDQYETMYMIMSFKTDQTEPQAERYNFTVGTVSYQYSIE